MRSVLAGAVILSAIGASGASTPAIDVDALVKKSVAATEHDWAEAPNFEFTEHDLQQKLDAWGRVKSTIDKTYYVTMIDRSPYNRLLKLNGKPLAPDQEKAEERKMQAERRRRTHQSASDRARRVTRYQRERKQDEAMMREMADGFNWKLAGEQTINGRPTFSLEATPKPGYVPKTRDTKVLTGMKGKLWIDKADTQWVKVEAEVVRPVSFYAVATVTPGTRFVLEQEPVGNGLWMPKHFSVRVNSSIFWIAHNSNDDETYANYKRVTGEPARVKTASANE